MQNQQQLPFLHLKHTHTITFTLVFKAFLKFMFSQILTSFRPPQIAIGSWSFPGASQELPRSLPGAFQGPSSLPGASCFPGPFQSFPGASQEPHLYILHAKQVATKIGFGHARKTFDKVRVTLPRSSSRQYHGKSQASCDENRNRPC